MQLSYRGVSYALNPSVEPSTPGEVIGKYRGAVLRRQHYTIPPAPQSFITLKYRGISYQAVANYSCNSSSTQVFQQELLAISG
ncbi:MAG: DUF4278 domain-containing protein [Microcoleus sp. SM1_3_4]|nr:DUF4278 domain-containing protein [Microcoleus sp. SM1_3_4]